MRIAVQTFIIVLVCLLGGLAMYSAAWFKFTEVEKLRDHHQQSLLAMRDIDHLETMFNQWFITIDLFFSQKQSDLAPGIARQSKQLHASITDIRKFAPHEEPVLHDEINNISRIIATASLQPKVANSLWNQQLAKADKETGLIVEHMEGLYSYFEQSQALSLAELERARKLLLPTLATYAATYVLLVLLVWVWANHTVVRPLQLLHRQALRPLDEQQEHPFELHSGPHEVQRLNQSLNHYSHRLIDTQRLCETEKSHAERSLAHTDSIMSASTDAILTIDHKGLVRHMNRATRDLFELAVDAEGQTEIGDLIPHLNKTPLELDIHHTQEFIGRSSADRKFPLEISAAPLKHGKGGYTLILRDITQRKLQELKVNKLNQKLVTASRQAGIAEIATGILHNIGNTLNAITTSASLLHSQTNQSSSLKVRKVADMLNNAEDLSELFAKGHKGRQLPGLLDGLCNQISTELEQQKAELTNLSRNIDHIAEILASQQKFANHTVVNETLDLAEVINDAIAMHSSEIRTHNIQLVRHFKPMMIQADRHNLMQILVNLIRNATEALVEQQPAAPTITITVESSERQGLQIAVQDNGTGLDDDQKQHLFRHGFTTKSGGHGFGLHSCALAAKNMQGELNADSPGPGLGCTFRLRLPGSTMKQAA